MRAAALFAQLTLFTFTEPRTAAGTQNRRKTTTRRRLGSRRFGATVVGMVLGAIFHFIKRVIHLIVGLLRLSYRKVSGRRVESYSDLSPSLASIVAIQRVCGS